MSLHTADLRRRQIQNNKYRLELLVERSVYALSPGLVKKEPCLQKPLSETSGTAFS